MIIKKEPVVKSSTNSVIPIFET